MELFPRIFVQCIEIDLNSETRLHRYGKHSFRVQVPGVNHQFIYEG